MNLIGRILIPVDLSSGSEAAAEVAAQLAAQLGASIDVLTVVDVSSAVDAKGAAAFRDGEVATLLNAARERLQEFAGRHFGAIASVRTHVIDGIVAVQILACAERFGSDLIVIGTHGRTGLGHLMLGSVAEKIVRRSAIPVLTVHQRTS